MKKPTAQQYSPLALMVKPTLMTTLRHGNTHSHAPPVIITPHQCFYLSTFDIKGEGYLALGMLPLSSWILFFLFVFEKRLTPLVDMSPPHTMPSLTSLGKK
jgi:hypothetical protein